MLRGIRSAWLAAVVSVSAAFGAQALEPETIVATVPVAVSLNSHLGGLYDADRIPNGRFGYVVMDAETGDILASRNEDALFIPASLSKIATTYAALANVGAGTRLSTGLLADGPVIDNVLHGDLHLVGSGDPSLRTQHLKELCDDIARAGIYGVTGRFLFHGDAIPESPRIDAAQPAGHHYNPGISGLNIDHNLRHRGSRTLAVSQPARRAARVLHYFAKTRGIELPEPRRAKEEPAGVEIATHESAPVSIIAAQMMRKSTNLTAEVLGVLAAKARGGDPKSLRDAARSTARWIEQETGPIGGAGWTGFALANHSGLSTRSRATPRQIAAILREGYRRFGDSFVRLHRETSRRGGGAYEIRAKVGSMRFVRGFGGFLKLGGRDMIFAIMANDDNRRAAADAGAVGLGSKPWMRKARELERALLSDWIADYWPRTAGL